MRQPFYVRGFLKRGVKEAFGSALEAPAVLERTVDVLGSKDTSVGSVDAVCDVNVELCRHCLHVFNPTE